MRALPTPPVASAHVPPPPVISRRAALAAAAVVPTLAPPRRAAAAPAPFCGVLDVIPPWAFTSPWREQILDAGGGSPLFTRIVGKEPGQGGVLSRFRKPTPSPPPYPVLIVPGEPMPCTYLESLELLAANRCGVFYDAPGFGQSRAAGEAASAADATPAAAIAAISRVADGVWVPGQRFHVVAHGLGGLYALAALNDRVASLTLLSTPSTPAAGVTGRADRAAALLGRDAAAVLAAGPSNPEFEQTLAAFEKQAVCKRPAGCVTAARARADPDAAALLAGPNPAFALGGALARWTPPPLARPAPPTLIINGGDGCVPASDAEALARLTGGQIRVVPAAGDYVHVDAAAEVLDAILAFVSAVEKA